MSNSAPLLAALLLVGGLAAGGYWLFGGSTRGLAPAALPPAAGPATADTAPGSAAAAGQPDSSSRTAIDPAREDRIAVAVDTANRDAAQGVKGRVLLPNGMPAGGLPIYLVENIINDPVGAFVKGRSGQAATPIAAGTTGADGTFAVGARRAERVYDLRVAGDSHPELTYQSIRLKANDWFDTGDLRLESGLVLGGRVIDEITSVGIAGATVYLTNSNQAHVLLPTPGRERGIAAITDANGAFRFDNAPPNCIIDLTAEAPGYAATALLNQQLRAGSAPTFTLEIAPGRPIAGIVVDNRGEPLPDVVITALGLSIKTPQIAKTTTDQNGVFSFPCLREGPYQLATDDRAFADTGSAPVMTGTTDVKLVLVQRPWVKLRVRTAAGQPIQSYRISLKRHFPGNPLGIGNVPEFADRSITPADYAEFGDQAAIHSLPTGEFVFQIFEPDHAKSLSPPFTVRQGQPATEVDATLTLGASISGTVVDAAGKPVGGAVVRTDMNHALAGSGGFVDFVKALIPERHSPAQDRTDAQGRFRLNRLAFADYMIRVAHPDYCDAEVLNLVLGPTDEVVDVGVVRLERGTVVEGYTTIGGMAAGQIKVSLVAPPAPAQNQPQMRAAEPGKMFAATAISDNDGYYRLLQRVPPGTYQVQALRAGGSGNPFEGLLDIRETEQKITIAAGQERMKLDFNLSAR